jgi:hypothetical protein
MRTPSEWKVLIVTRFASSGAKSCTRSRISSAALFVNVTATRLGAIQGDDHDPVPAFDQNGVLLCGVSHCPLSLVNLGRWSPPSVGSATLASEGIRHDRDFSIEHGVAPQACRQI